MFCGTPGLLGTVRKHWCKHYNLENERKNQKSGLLVFKKV
jgi:hypothetical protein